MKATHEIGYDQKVFSQDEEFFYQEKSLRSAVIEREEYRKYMG